MNKLPKIRIRKSRRRLLKRNSSDGVLDNDTFGSFSPHLYPDLYNDQQFLKMGRTRSMPKHAYNESDEYSISEIIHAASIIIAENITSSIRDGYKHSPEYRDFNLGGCGQCDSLISIPCDNVQCDEKELIRTVDAFFKFLQYECQLEPDCVIIAVIYLERIRPMTDNKFRISLDNWKACLFSCCLIAAKVWDDFAMPNSEFAYIFRTVPVERVNLLEYKLLVIFDFNINVSVKDFVTYDYRLKKIAAAVQSDDAQNQMLKSDSDDTTDQSMPTVSVSAKSSASNISDKGPCIDKGKNEEKSTLEQLISKLFGKSHNNWTWG